MYGPTNSVTTGGYEKITNLKQLHNKPNNENIFYAKKLEQAEYNI